MPKFFYEYAVTIEVEAPSFEVADKLMKLRHVGVNVATGRVDNKGEYVPNDAERRPSHKPYKIQTHSAYKKGSYKEDDHT